ncbi:MAG: AMP-binding protein [Gammaproteobacteria bacterium]|jgi:carnitine-CoA ligase|nr:AMP-binding protein [Gammaproteobacteria bacterium]MBT4493293.1 AMP-binding protein [Gammaproteobacteria bacterium]MBT7371255.1 AMP-binding protein [Gammaproteobacteria bacterium]
MTSKRLYSGDWVLTSLLLDRAERFTDETAIIAMAEDLTWADLIIRAQSVAGYLQQLGVSKGDRVATMLPSTPDYLAAWHGILWCGAIDVPVNNEYRGLFLEHIINDAGAEVLVIAADWVPRLQGLNLHNLKHIIVAGDFDAASSFQIHAFSDALSSKAGQLVTTDAKDTTYLMYTSGTTGAAKGVIHNNRSSINYIMPFVEGLALDDDDVCYSMFPLFHQMGRSACTTTAIWTGTPVVLRPSFSASEFWQDIRSTGATWMGYFGVVIALLARQDASPDDRNHRLRRAFGASAPRELIPEWKERFGVQLYETYGSTEIGLGSGLGSGPPKTGTMGLPTKQLELQIVDEFDNPLPANEIGEAVWRPRKPDTIFQGYWDRPEATVQAWRNLWFHSGDAGLIDEDGYFIFKDRIKDSIRRRGENISSIMLEESVLAEPGIAECAAYAVPSEIGDTDDEVMIAVVLEDPVAFDAAELFTNLCKTVPRHAVPRFLRLKEELPRTPTQRIQKYKLRDEGITSDSYDRESMGIFPER